MKQCTWCNGTGSVPIMDSGTTARYKTCSKCYGRGFVEEPCIEYDGDLVINEAIFNVPPNIKINAPEPVEIDLLKLLERITDLENRVLELERVNTAMEKNS